MGTVKRRIYVVCAELSGPCKIGIATNMTRRLCSLQNGNPDRLRAVFVSEPHPMAEAVERAAHQHLRRKRLVGEWFSITAGEAIEAIHDLLGLPRPQRKPAVRSRPRRLDPNRFYPDGRPI